MFLQCHRNQFALGYWPIDEHIEMMANGVLHYYSFWTVSNIDETTQRTRWYWCLAKLWHVVMCRYLFRVILTTCRRHRWWWFLWLDARLATALMPCLHHSELLHARLPRSTCSHLAESFGYDACFFEWLCVRRDKFATGFSQVLFPRRSRRKWLGHSKRLHVEMCIEKDPHLMSS